MQGASTTETYTYDPVGNRLSSLGVSSYSNNSSNELTSASNANYTYDNNGNTLTKVVGSNTTSFAWDYENRLTSVTLPGSGGTVTFKYDPFGRRSYKSSTNGTSIFAYDGDNLIEEANSTGTAVARYSQGLNIDEPLAMLRSSITSYYQADGLGSVTSLSNSSGVLAQEYTFDSFGNRTASSGSLTNPFQYTAREFDPETGLYNYRSRYFDPVAGRFLSEDPIGFDGGVNFYRYVSQNPTNAVDPMGLQGPGLVAGTEAGCAIGGPAGCVVGGAAGETVDLALSVGASAMFLKALHDIAKPCPDDQCAGILGQIYKTMNDLNKRILDLLNDPRDLYNLAYSVPNPSATGTNTTFLGHIQQAEDTQQRLRNLIGQAMSQGCTVPKAAWKFATRPLPTQPLPKNARKAL